MLNDAQVLAALSDWLSPGEIAGVLQRILRVPEAWQHMHDPAHLASVREARLPTPFSPSHLGQLALVPAEPHWNPLGPLPEELVAKQEALWRRALHAVPPDPDLEGVQLLALALVAKAEEPQGPERLASFVLSAPRTWRSPLACAWMHLPASTQTLAGLLATDQPQGIMLAANSLLANLTPSEAARIWISVQPDPSADALLKLQNMGEPALAGALAELMKRTDAAVPRSDPVHELLALAARRHIEQDLRSAHEALDRAWSNVVKSTSIVAEQLAELARAEGDLVLAAEARKQALRTEPTPLRRAHLAVALLELGQADEALLALPRNLQCNEEYVAAGLVRLELDQQSQAADLLRTAAQGWGEMDQLDGRWLDRLSTGLRTVGEVAQALDIAWLRLAASPCDLNARIALTLLLADAGDLSTAAQEAHLSFALAPGSKEARRLLAGLLQKAGQANAALAHWQALSEDNPEYRVELIDCALAAGDTSLAQQSAQAALREKPEDARTQILYARTLAAHGDTAGARLQLEQAIEKDPQQSDAWLALADCLAAAGDSQAQGATLASAVQASPEQGSLQIAYALWLQSNERISEALDAARTAIELEPGRVDWLISYGGLLQALGHEEQALAVLQQAHHQQPANWQARRRLAELYEKRCDPRTAWSFLDHVPDDQDSATHIMAGRIAVQAAQAGDPSSLSAGLEHLERARSIESHAPELHYWLGVALQLANRLTEAIQAFRACLSGTSFESEAYRRGSIGLANCLIIEGQAEQAVTALEPALAYLPNDISLLITLSQALAAAGQAERSLTVAQQAVDIDPQSAQGLEQLARAAEAAERKDLALNAAERLAQLRPQDAEAWIHLARLASSCGSVARARSAVANAVSLDRKNAAVLRQCAELLIELGLLRLAQRMLERAAAVEPDDVALLRLLGNLAQQNRDHEAARGAWVRISELEPRNSDSLYRAGLSYWDSSFPAEAIDHWQRALELDPTSSEIQAALGHALLMGGESERGFQHLASAMELNPEDPRLALDTGQAALRSGRHAEAAELLRRASRMAPDDVETTETLAKCLMELKQPQEAHEMLKRACINGEAPASTHALRAVAALYTGDIQASEQAMIDAVGIAPQNALDAGALAQAAVRLGHWSEAVQVSQSYSQENADPEALLAHARLCLRVADAHWLYAIEGQAPAHAPDDECLMLTEPVRVEALLQRSSQAGASQTDLDLLRLRASASQPGSAQEALTALEAQLSLRNDPEVAEGLVIAYLRSRQPDQALQALRLHIPKGNGAGWAQILKGIALAHLGRHEQAQQAYDLSGDDPALRPLAQFLSSKSLHAQGDTRGAAADLNSASTAWPTEASWHFQLAQLYSELNDRDAAMPHYQQAAELHPDSGQYALEFARALRDLGQSSAAATAFAKVVKNLPEDGSAWREAGEAVLVSGDPKRAQELFERACTIAPSDAASLMGSARALQSLGNLREAQDRAQAALRLAPKDADVLMGLGEILAAQAQFEKAIRTYDQALSLAKDPIPVQLRRSDLMVKLGRAPQAVEQLIEIVHQNPDDDRIWGALCLALEEAGDLESAMEAATRTVRLAPRNAAYRLALGRVSRKSGQLDRAIQELTQAGSIAPSESEIATELGKAHAERRQLPLALEAFQRAISLNPNSASAHFGAAMVHKELKSYQQASDELRRALELDPNDPESHHQLAAVRALALVHGGILQPVE